MKKTSFIEQRIVIVVTVLAILLAGTLFFTNKNSNDKEATSSQLTNEQIEIGGAQADANATLKNTESQNEQLLYLIEEEKLAHDVYQAMYDIYGEKVFGNILRSEETHQSRVKTLLDARSIDDPRLDDAGKFVNKELQELYDRLIVQGKQSAEEAFKVGVAIEEKDIKDITDQLATATDGDIVSALEDLRRASENHLRAFNRQLSRY